MVLPQRFGQAFLCWPVRESLCLVVVIVSGYNGRVPGPEPLPRRLAQRERVLRMPGDGKSSCLVKDMGVD